MKNIDLRYLGQMCGVPLYLDVSGLESDEEKKHKELLVKSLLRSGLPKAKGAA